jgi:hypothetical protein
VSLLDFLGPLVGNPSKRDEDKQDPTKAPITAPEFDITQYAKRLAVVIGVLFPAILGVLRAAHIKIDEGVIIAALGVTAASLLGACFVMASDILGRAYADRSQRWTPAPPLREYAESKGRAALMTVWLHDQPEPCPVIAIIPAPGNQARYLILHGTTSTKTQNGRQITVYDDPPRWVNDSDIVACTERTG